MVYRKEGNIYKGSTLPVEAQLSMTTAFTTITIGDKIYLAGIGNFYDTDFEYARYDAGKGYLLEGGKTLAKVPGFAIYGNMRSLVTLDAKSVVVCGSDEGCKMVFF
jgi:hypothetical protein